MSEVNYEALGRCDHLRGEINKAHHEREMALLGLTQLHRSNGVHQQVYDEVKKINIDAFQNKLDVINSANEKLMKLVEEHNAWAEQAGKKPIRYSQF